MLTRTSCPEDYNGPIRSGLPFWGVNIIAAASMILMAVQWQIIQDSRVSPKKDLESFIMIESNKNQVADIDDIPLEMFSLVSAAPCLSGSFEFLKEELLIQLEPLPYEIRQKIVRLAIREKITVKNSFQDSISSLDQNSQAHTYMAFYSTVYDETENFYETCVVVAGMEIAAAEVIQDWNEELKPINLGMKDCDPCGGIVRCRQCPNIVYEQMTTPIYKKYLLTFSKHEELHRRMVAAAVSAAQRQLGISFTKIDSGRPVDDEEEKLNALHWKNPGGYPKHTLPST